MLALFISVQFDITRQAVNSMGQAKLVVLTLLVTLVIHPFWSYLYIEYFQLGIRGAAIANISSFTLNLAVLHVLILGRS